MERNPLLALLWLFCILSVDKLKIIFCKKIQKMSRPPTKTGGGSAHVPGTSSLVNSICKIGEIVKRFSAMNVQFTDNSKEVLEAMQQAAVRARIS